MGNIRTLKNRGEKKATEHRYMRNEKAERSELLPRSSLFAPALRLSSPAGTPSGGLFHAVLCASVAHQMFLPSRKVMAITHAVINAADGPIALWMR